MFCIKSVIFINHYTYRNKETKHRKHASHSLDAPLKRAKPATVANNAQINALNILRTFKFKKKDKQI
ncbi:MAG: hypothetical protein C0412_01925 [Flavobacterium sp.]|nr:hypothetical protein [Flavobacterium sp.]